MDLNLILVCVVIAVALFFSYTNGFHDAANAIATSVSTRAWTPRAALLMAATMNVIGAMMGTAVAKTVGKGIISISDYAESPLPEMQQKGLVIILAALLGACIWNLITWWFGLPSSSSHALIGGMVGAGLMSGTVVHWWGIMSHVVIPMFASPIIGFVVGYIAMKLVLWALRKAQYHRTMRRFRAAQRFSSAAMALGHGIQDAQKTMGHHRHGATGRRLRRDTQHPRSHHGRDERAAVGEGVGRSGDFTGHDGWRRAHHAHDRP